jgi:hypothetical protein
MRFVFAITIGITGGSVATYSDESLAQQRQMFRKMEHWERTAAENAQYDRENTQPLHIVSDMALEGANVMFHSAEMDYNYLERQRLKEVAKDDFLREIRDLVLSWKEQAEGYQGPFKAFLTEPGFLESMDNPIRTYMERVGKNILVKQICPQWDLCETLIRLIKAARSEEAEYNRVGSNLLTFANNGFMQIVEGKNARIVADRNECEFIFEGLLGVPEDLVRERARFYDPENSVVCLRNQDTFRNEIEFTSEIRDIGVKVLIRGASWLYDWVEVRCGSVGTYQSLAHNLIVTLGLKKSATRIKRYSYVDGTSELLFNKDQARDMCKRFQVAKTEYSEVLTNSIDDGHRVGHRIHVWTGMLGYIEQFLAYH